MLFEISIGATPKRQLVEIECGSTVDRFIDRENFSYRIIDAAPRHECETESGGFDAESWNCRDADRDKNTLFYGG